MRYALRAKGQPGTIAKLLAALAEAARLRAKGAEDTWACTEEIVAAVIQAQRLTRAGTQANLQRDAELKDVTILAISDAAEWGAGPPTNA